MNNFQLYKTGAGNPSMKFTYNLIDYNIDLEQFQQSSQLISKKRKEINHTDEKNIIAVLTFYLDDILKKAGKDCEIRESNYMNFLSLISGKQQNLSNESLFDFFKLSDLFEIRKLLDFIKSICSKASKIQDVFSIIKRGDTVYKISKNEECFYNKFIEFGNMDKMLVENIQELFDDLGFVESFPLSTLFILLKKCKSKEGIPPDRLYKMISKSLENQLHFLPYLDVFRLDESTQEKLFEKIKVIEDKLSPSEEEPKKQISNKNSLQKTQKNESDEKSDHFDISQVPSKKLNTNNLDSLYQTTTYRPKDSSSKTTNSIYSSYSQISKTTNPYKNQSNASIDEADITDQNQLKDSNQSNNLTSSSKNQSQNQLKDFNQSNNLTSSSKNQSQNQLKDFNQSNNLTSSSNKLPKLTDNTLNNAHSGVNIDSITRANSSIPPSYKSDLTTSHGIKKTESDDKYHPPTSYKNKQRIEIFNENKKIVQAGYYIAYIRHEIRKDLDYSLKNTIIISDQHQLHLNHQILSKAKHLAGLEKVQIYKNVEVTSESTFAAAIRGKNISKKLCVLNFASATQPGGGVLNGRNAQEEVLSRQSTLYFSIAQMKDFYDHNKRKNDPMGTDYMIYSPNVIIIRDDNDKLIDPVKVSVISSVAVNYGEIFAKSKNELDDVVSNVMLNRCRRILELCIDKGNDVIVLGAFGCGVFKNPPELISSIFKFLIVDEGYGLFFKKIIFAIKIKPDQTTELIDTFKKAFLPPKPQSMHHKK